MSLGQPSTKWPSARPRVAQLALPRKVASPRGRRAPLALAGHRSPQELGITRLEFSRRSGISRGTLRDLELGIQRDSAAVATIAHLLQRAKVKSESLDKRFAAFMRGRAAR